MNKDGFRYQGKRLSITRVLTCGFSIAAFAASSTRFDLADARPSMTRLAFPIPPPYISFTDCQVYPENDSVLLSVCVPPEELFDSQISQIGLAVDADQHKRHIGFVLIKVSSPSKGTAFFMEQVIYNCLLRKAQSREIKSAFGLPGSEPLPVEKPDMRWKDSWRPDLAKESITLIESCPTKSGFTRIGKHQFALDGVLRRGNSVYIRVYDENVEREYVISLDCSSLSVGFESQPKVLITPGSIGEELSQRVCR